ncbi:DinB family protein [Glutamicibacter sp. JC586]|uniref:DinB family protein n=1 Tax=Glutamicibacter sp. JC586 TaxID=2590552 RepID=UPI00135931EF|nr:DinB family protein [Glutamicibacter sp. JC586]
MPNPGVSDVYNVDHDAMVQIFIDQHRRMLRESLDGLTESEARAQMVNSKTTLLGLLKHAIFVERVWFGEAASGISRSELGIPASPDDSFDLSASETIVSVIRDYDEAVAHSQQAVEGKTGEDIFPGNRRGPLPLRWVQLHVLRELAQHCGHADILREHIMDARQTAITNNE